MNKKLILVAAAIVGAAMRICPNAHGLTITESSTPGAAIPDNNLVGVTDTINLSTAISSIADVSVTLDIAGGYNGDFYAYLRHGATGFAVLLNRVGSTSANPFGSSDSGFGVTLTDSAAVDVHSASAGGGNALSGIFQPDGRVPVSGPAYDAIDTTPRTALLNSFDGMNANGAWTLFIADVSPVGIGTLTDWSLTVDGTSAVPDGGWTATLLAMSLAGLFALRSRLLQAPCKAV